MAESLIEIRGVNKVFDLGKLQVHALRDMEWAPPVPASHLSSI